MAALACVAVAAPEAVARAAHVHSIRPAAGVLTPVQAAWPLPSRAPTRCRLPPTLQLCSSILGGDDNDLREAALAVAQQLAADDGSLRLMQQPVRGQGGAGCGGVFELVLPSGYFVAAGSCHSLGLMLWQTWRNS